MIAASAAGLALAGGSFAPAGVPSNRIVDRTLLCATASVFGERWVTPGGNAETTWPARLGVSTGNWTVQGSSLAGAEAARSSGRTTGNVWFARNRCRDVQTSVPLTSRGLPGPPDLWSRQLRCPVGARVLVRVRAVGDRAIRWRTSGADRNLLVASANLSTASLAVRTYPERRPVAFATFDARGNFKLWTAGNCSR